MRYRNDLFVITFIIALSALFRGIVEDIIFLQYGGVISIRGSMLYSLRQHTSPIQKEHIRSYGVVITGVLLFLSIVHSVLTNNYLFLLGTGIIGMSFLRSIQVTFFQKRFRGSYLLKSNDLIPLFALLVTVLIGFYFSFALQERTWLVAITGAIIVFIVGNLLTGNKLKRLGYDIGFCVLIGVRCVTIMRYGVYVLLRN